MAQADEKARQPEPAPGDDSAAKARAAPKRPSLMRNPLALAAMAIAVVAVLLAALLWWLEARRWQATDDAFVDGHIVHLAPQISGTIVRIYVTDNAQVRAGQPLLDIDPASFRAQVEQVSAQAAQAEAQIVQQRAQAAAARATYRQARADAAAVAAQAKGAADDLARYRRLRAIAPQAVSAQQLDQALTAARNTSAQHQSALQKAQTAAEQIRAAEAQIGALEAQARASAALVKQSHITLGDTRLVAPIDGHIAHLNAAPGGYVQPGQELMAVVPNNLWVTANFKETQLALMRVGQRADVRIDACKGVLRAHVDSIQRGAGQAFALLPPENATGNYVKVVQRVPVKLMFDAPPRDCPLGPGLSVQPKVLVRP